MKSLYAQEFSVQQRTQDTLDRYQGPPSELLDEYRKLAAQYRELLQQAVKVTTLSDAAQRQLVQNNRQLQQTIAEAHGLNEEKNEILALAAHDLRTPLAAIVTAADLLTTPEILSDDEHSELLQHILHEAEGMLDMISDLLDIYRFEAAAIEGRTHAVSLESLIDRIHRAHKKAAEKKNIQLDLHTEHPARVVVLDEPLFLRVAQNLLSNALKFSPSKTKVTLLLREETGRLILKVADEGPGISEEDQKKLFQKVGRLSPRPTGGEASAGLGLVLVNRILHKIGGSVRCESELGAGTKFIVEFPFAEA